MESGYHEQETNTMLNEPEIVRTTEPDEPKTTETPEDKQLDRVADDLAAKAGKRENLYDRNHGTFPRGGPSGVS